VHSVLLRGDGRRRNVPPGIHAGWEPRSSSESPRIRRGCTDLPSNRGSTCRLGDVHAGIVDRLLSGGARVAARVVGAKPGGEAEWIPSTRRSAGGTSARPPGAPLTIADRLVIDALHLVARPSFHGVTPRRSGQV